MKRLATLLLFGILPAVYTAGATIGVLSQSARDFTASPNMTAVFASRGASAVNGVNPETADLSVYCSLWGIELTSLMNSVGQNALLAYLNGPGHTVVLTVDSGNAGVASSNALVQFLTGQSNAFGGAPVNASIAGLATPYNVVGQSLSVSPGTKVNVGTQIAGSYLTVFGFQSGSKLYLAGDHFINDVFVSTIADVNAQVALDLCPQCLSTGGGGNPGGDGGNQNTPEPATSAFVLVATVAGIVILRRK